MTESLTAVLGKSLTEKIREGKVSLADVVKVLVPEAPTEALEEYKIPLPATITAKAKAALEKLPEVYGGVVPTERRKLTDEELTALLAERDVCDTIKKLVEARKDSGIRTSILNHMDVVLEETLTEEQLKALERDKDGHYYSSAQVTVPESDQVFSWEVSPGTATLSPQKLKELDAAGEIDHKLYLEITEPVRVVNEQRLLLAMSKDPETVLALVKAASKPAKKKGSLYVR
jgi:hypothetical protein